MTRNYERLHERMEYDILPNGLQVCHIPKEGFSKTFAILATDFGSCGQSFEYKGKRHDTPAGVAHFLEHKMFEDEDGNALQKFAKTGASPNAFTSQNITAYHFSCTERFAENLDILTKFVFTPYFTKENVAKEQGIIAQEIGMINDTPGWRVYTALFEALYQEHPSRVPIAGSRESISEITPEILYTCHEAFYTPSNMALVVCGPADFKEICEIAYRNSPESGGQKADCFYGKNYETVNAPTINYQMRVSQPQFLLGFKDEPVKKEESRLKRMFLGDLAVRILCGETSELYAELYDKHLIGRDFDTDYTLIPGGAQAVFGGESRNPDAVREAIEEKVKRLSEDGVEEHVFSRMKKAVYGMYLRMIESPEGFARREITSLFGGEHCTDFAEIADKASMSEVQKMFSVWAGQGKSAMSVIEPQ